MPIKARVDMLSTGIRTPVGVKIFGPKLEEINEIGSQIEGALGSVQGTRNVFAERVTGGIRRRFGVDLHRDSDLAVSQDAHSDTRVDVKGGQQRGASLAGAVHGDPGNPRSHDAPVEAAVEVARLNRRAVPGGKAPRPATLCLMNRPRCARSS